MRERMPERGWSIREPVPFLDLGLISHLPRVCKGDCWHTHILIVKLIIYQACVLCVAQARHSKHRDGDNTRQSPWELQEFQRMKQVLEIQNCTDIPKGNEVDSSDYQLPGAQSDFTPTWHAPYLTLVSIQASWLFSDSALAPSPFIQTQKTEL